MALMSLGTGTGMDDSISKVWEREGNEKSTSPYNSGTGRDKNPFPEFGNGKEMKKTHSQISGAGIRGFHSWE